jgi:serine/threonine protein kinase
MAAIQTAIGSTQFGPFVLLEKIGHGATGTLYKARGPGRESLVALKVANRIVATDPVLPELQEEEQSTFAALRHPHIVGALDQGEVNGVPYRTLEFFPAKSLAQRIHEEGPLSLAQARRVFTQIAEAVAFLHKNKVVHRDIKPSSVLIQGSAAKLSDMGVVHDLKAATIFMRSRVGLGTIEFVAPELFEDVGQADSQSDIYALAATFYIALTGRPAFGPGSLGAVITRKLDHQLTPLATLVPGVSSALDEMITWALHPDPALRPASAEQFLAALQGETEHEEPSLAIEVSSTESLAGAEADVRRTNTRYPIDMVTACQILSPANKVLCRARLLDISIGGVCLEIPQRFEANTLLHVSLPHDDTTHPPAYPATVRWNKGLSNDNWMVGCAFSQPLEENELERLLAR